MIPTFKRSDSIFDDGGDELPDHVVAEHGGGVAVGGIARAARGLEELGRHRFGIKVAAVCAAKNDVRFVHAIDGRGLGPVDLGPLVTETA